MLPDHRTDNRGKRPRWREDKYRWVHARFSDFFRPYRLPTTLLVHCRESPHRGTAVNPRQLDLGRPIRWFIGPQHQGAAAQLPHNDILLPSSGRYPTPEERQFLAEKCPSFRAKTQQDCNFYPPYVLRRLLVGAPPPLVEHRETQPFRQRGSNPKLPPNLLGYLLCECLHASKSRTFPPAGSRNPEKPSPNLTYAPSLRAASFLLLLRHGPCATDQDRQ